MTLRLYPLPSLFDEDIASVRASTPVDVSGFYVKRTYNVPWSSLPTTFIFETDTPNVPHAFTVNKTETVTIVPGSAMVTLQVQLEKGTNRIEMEAPVFPHRGLWNATTPYQRFDSVGYDNEVWVCLQDNTGVTPAENSAWTIQDSLTSSIEREHVTIAATALQTWFHALGREVYLDGAKRLREVQAQLFSPWTTRISAHLLPYNDLFLPVRMPKIQQTRLALTASVGGRLGYGDGVIRVATAASYSTPWVSRTRDSEFNLPGKYPRYPGVTTFATTSEGQGRLLDVWSPNLCLATKLALTQITLSVGAPDVPSPKPIELVDFDDNQVLLRLNGGPVESHELMSQCSGLEIDQDCTSSVRVSVESDAKLEVFMSSPQLGLDAQVELPLLFGFFDLGDDLDNGYLDTVDDLDPLGTGFLGVPLSARLDQNSCLDTRIQRGRRLTSYLSPVEDSLLIASPTTEQAGTALTVHVVPGSPTGEAGTTEVWASSPLNFIYQGDLVRFPNEAHEVQIVSAVPVFTQDSIVVKSASLEVSQVGTKFVLTDPSLSFFEPRHEGMGVRLMGSGTEYASIASVDVATGTAVLAGNPVLTTGTVLADVYLPARDPTVTVGAPFAGNRLFHVIFAEPLAFDQTDGVILDQRHPPLAVQAINAEDTVVRIASDIEPLPGSHLFFTENSSQVVLMATATGQHHTTGLKVYDVFLAGGAPAPIAENAPLFVVREESCWQGSPVTPLTTISMAPTDFLVP